MFDPEDGLLGGGAGLALRDVQIAGDDPDVDGAFGPVVSVLGFDDDRGARIASGELDLRGRGG